MWIIVFHLSEFFKTNSALFMAEADGEMGVRQTRGAQTTQDVVSQSVMQQK